MPASRQLSSRPFACGSAVFGRCPIRTLLPGLLAVFLLAAAAAPAHGQSTGLDLVVLIDQSGSMWGHPKDHPAQNDKWGHRFGATQEVILRLLNNVRDDSQVHRFSVIDFGDDAEVAWSKQTLRFDSKDPGALAREVQSQLARRVRGREWGNTNTPRAMELAAKEFSDMAKTEPKTGRRRILLLITDGRANLYPDVDLATMRDRVQQQAEKLRKQGVEIWVIGLNDADPYWLDGDGAFWEEVAGDERRARLAERASTSVPQIFYDLVDEWLEVSGTAVGDEYFCPPYRTQLSLRVNFGKPHGAIRILDPLGVEVPQTAGGAHSRPGTYVHFDLRDPVPGRYEIGKESDRHYVIHAETSPPRLVRLHPAGVADLEVATRIVFQAINGAGEPLAMDPAWPIKPSLTVTPPSGTPFELTVSVEGDGRFEAPWKPEEAGVYQLELSGLVPLPKGSQLDVFAGTDAVTEIEVSNLRPYWLRLTRPRPEKGLTAAPWDDSTRIELVLIDAEEQVVEDLAARVREPESWLALELIDPSGVVSSPIALAPESAGTFAATVPLAPDWRGSSGLRRLGTLRLRVEAESGRLGDEHYLNAIRLPSELADRRIDGDPMTVGPIDVLLPWWLVGLPLIPVLGVLGLLLWLLLTRIVPDLLIRRRDAARGGKVELKIFDMVADPTGAGARPLAVSGKRTFKLDGAVAPVVEGKTVTAQRFRVTRLNVPGKARARLEYRWQDDKTTHLTLLTAGSVKPLQGLTQGSARTVALLSEGS